MAFSINSNISAMQANLYSNLNNQGLNKSLNALSSGSKLNFAAYDASGLSIANKLSSQVSGLGQAIQNSNDSIGMIQIADGALQGINDNMQRIRTLTLKAANGSMSDASRGAIQKEIDALLKSSGDIATQTSYNGMKLLDGTGGGLGDGSFVTQSGAYGGDTQSLNIGDAQPSSMFGSIDITTADGRSSALETIDGAIGSVNSIRSDLGSSQNQLMSNIRNISVTQVNVASAESQIRDVDFAQESANFSRQNLMSQVGSFTQAQANANASRVTNLFS